MSEVSYRDYKQLVEEALASGESDVNVVFKSMIELYVRRDRDDDVFWDAEDDFDTIGLVMYHSVKDDHAGSFDVRDGGSELAHFFGGLTYESMGGIGEFAQLMWEWSGDWSSPITGFTPDARRDTALAYYGAWIANQFDTDDRTARCLMKIFLSGYITLTDVLGPATTAQDFATEESFDHWLQERKAWFSKRANAYCPGSVEVVDAPATPFPATGRKPETVSTPHSQPSLRSLATELLRTPQTPREVRRGIVTGAAEAHESRSRERWARLQGLDQQLSDTLRSDQNTERVRPLHEAEKEGIALYLALEEMEWIDPDATPEPRPEWVLEDTEPMMGGADDGSTPIDGGLAVPTRDPDPETEGAASGAGASRSTMIKIAAGIIGAGGLILGAYAVTAGGGNDSDETTQEAQPDEEVPASPDDESDPPQDADDVSDAGPAIRIGPVDTYSFAPNPRDLAETLAAGTTPTFDLVEPDESLASTVVSVTDDAIVVSSDLPGPVAVQVVDGAGVVAFTAIGSPAGPDMAAATRLVFTDGFESADTSSWAGGDEQQNGAVAIPLDLAVPTGHELAPGDYSLTSYGFESNDLLADGEINVTAATYSLSLQDGLFSADEAVELTPVDQLALAYFDPFGAQVQECIADEAAAADQMLAVLFPVTLEKLGIRCIVAVQFPASAIAAVTAAGFGQFSPDQLAAAECLAGELASRIESLDQFQTIGTQPYAAWPVALQDLYVAALEACFDLEAYYFALFSAFEFNDPTCARRSTDDVMANHSIRGFVDAGSLSQDAATLERIQTDFNGYVEAMYPRLGCEGVA